MSALTGLRLQLSRAVARMIFTLLISLSASIAAIYHLNG